MADGVQRIALLRGINVGGKSLIKMADLRETFEEMGFADVSTYIASGNVLFRSPREKRAELAARVESELSRRFELELKVVLLTKAELRGVVNGSPRGFGWDTHLCDVVFLRKPLTAKKTIGLLQMREGVDQAWAGTGVIYMARLEAKKTTSRLNKVASLPEYKNMTIRSWSTTTKLLGLMDSR
jgi:uncharacterized protein (DUF1697 family)